MTYIEAFRNTTFVDFLELTGLVKLPSHFKPQTEAAEPATQTSAETTARASEELKEKDVESQASIIKEVAEVASAVSDENEVVPFREEDQTHNNSNRSRSNSRHSLHSNFDLDTFKHEMEQVVPALSNRSKREGLDAGSADPFLVDWNGPDDPENPINWSRGKKIAIVLQVMFLTCVTYMGSSIYTPGQLQIQEEFGVGHVVATLNLSLFVLGYGLGPIIFSPLSEQAKIGRLYLYMGTLTLFVILQIPAALTRNIGGLIVTRFITGILCSPSISTGGATLGDFVQPHLMPYLIGCWAMGAVSAPAFAPLLGAAMVVAKNWRYTFWLLMAMCGFALAIFIFFFPETSHKNILYRRARRIRKETGDSRYYTIGEREEEHQSTSGLLKEVLSRPFLLILSEPGVLAFDLYIGLVYSAFYLFFEAYPIVFVEYYHFTLVEFGLAYLGFIVGSFFAFAVLVIFLRKIIFPRFADGSFVPEDFLILAMWVCFLLPASLFLFAWTAQVHWILPIVWELLFVVSAFNIFQSAFAYLSSNYPRYLASVFAGNALVRSGMACAFPLFGSAMYNTLATPNYMVGWGSSLVGFLTLAMAAIPFVMYKFGPRIRGRSKYAN